MPWTTTKPSLLRRLQISDDHAAWRIFDSRYGPLIAGYARRRGLSPDDADDVRQIVLLSLVRAMPTFEFRPERGRFRSYLGRVVGNAIHRYRNRPFRSREIPMDDLDLPHAPAPGTGNCNGDGDGDRDETWEREWVQFHLRRAVARVRQTFDDRSIHVFEQLLAGATTNVIADREGMTVEAVRKVRQRVRRRLQELVAEQIEEEDGFQDGNSPAH